MFEQMNAVCNTVSEAFRTLDLFSFMCVLGTCIDQYQADAGIDFDTMQDSLKDIVALRVQVRAELGDCMPIA